MAFTISFAMAGSLLLTLTVIPVLAALILKPQEERDTLLVRVLKKRYLPLLEWSLSNKRKVVTSALGVLVATLVLFPFLGKEFMPTLQEGSIMWRVTSIPSASLDQSIEISKDIENALNEFPEVQTTIAMIGRAEKGETADVNYMEIYTELNPEDEWPEDRTVPELAEAMREELESASYRPR